MNENYPWLEALIQKGWLYAPEERISASEMLEIFSTNVKK